MRKVYILFFFLFTLTLYSQSGVNGHNPTQVLWYAPTGYSAPTSMRQASSVTNAAKNTITDADATNCFVNFIFDTSGKSVYIVYTNNGSVPSKSNGTSVICTFSNYVDPNRTFLGIIPSAANIAGSEIRYVFYISNGDLASAWGRVAASGYATTWTEGDSYFNYEVSFTNNTGGGKWSSNSTWVGGSVPTSGKKIEIRGSSDVELDQNANLSQLMINSGGTLLGADGTARTLTIASGGTFTNNGTFTPTANSTVNFAGNGTITGTVTFNDVQIAGGVNFGSSSTVNGKLTINSGGWVNTNVPTYGASSTLVYNPGLGGYVSALEWPETNSPPNVEIANSTPVTLSAARTISGSLNLTSGLLILGLNNLTLGASATIGGTPSASSMVVTSGSGELRKTFTGTGSFTFPVGDNTSTAEYSPVTLDFTSGTFSSAYAGVKVVNEKHPSNASTSHYINRYWTVTSSGISSFSCDASFLYKDADIIGTESNLYCGKYSGSVWTGYGQAAYGENKLSASGVTGFSDFTGGESGAMPVELTSFAAKQTGSNVTLNWKTATETNNYGFEVQKSSDNSTWNKIGFVQGAGNSNSPKEYSYTDKLSNLNGKFYYRLKQIDNDGTISFSKVVEVENLKPSVFNLSQNYPNPFNPSTVIKYQIPVDSRVSVKVYNVLGNVVATLQNGFQTAGEYSVTLDGSNLASGVYFYKIEAGEFTATKKMLLTK